MNTCIKCILCFVYFVQMVEDPTIIYRGQRTGARLYASDSIKVLREEEAFSFGSLVADCGGVLGLFIGFNFLMIWDWMISVLILASPKVQNC